MKKILIIFASLMFPFPSAFSATAVDTDWPCIQAYVPEVAIAVVWPEPVEDEQIDAWRSDKELKPVVRKFGALEQFTDADRDQLIDFAESIPAENQIDVLNKVASGIVSEFNTRRTDYVKGIRKYTRQQIAVALQIEAHLNELASLGDSTDPTTVAKKQAIEETTAWQQRIFDKRERAISLLCETPVELESLLGDIVRELAQSLP